MDVTSALLDHFKQLVEERGISGDSVVVNQSHGTEQKNGRREQVDLGFKPDNRWLCSHRR